MISGVAFCPHPPVLVPEVAGAAAGELETLRAACRTAIGRVAARGAHLVVVGAGPVSAKFLPTARGTLAPYGVPVEIPLGSDAPGAVEVPLSLTIGAWLVRDALGPGSGATGWSVGPDAAPPELDDSQDTVLIVMGDGSARRTEKAPGYLDERAGAVDAALALALAAGDAAALRTDPDLAADLLVAGARAWTATAAVAGLAGRDWDAELLYDSAPYGVAYVVAAWTVRA